MKSRPAIPVLRIPDDAWNRIFLKLSNVVDRAFARARRKSGKPVETGKSVEYEAKTA